MFVHRCCDVGHDGHVVDDGVCVRWITLMFVIEEYDIIIAEGVGLFNVRDDD